jgi:hypothetical protein
MVYVYSQFNSLLHDLCSIHLQNHAYSAIYYHNITNQKLTFARPAIESLKSITALSTGSLSNIRYARWGNASRNGDCQNNPKGCRHLSVRREENNKPALSQLIFLLVAEDPAIHVIDQ